MTEHTNQLIHEKSPYLLQHAHNPVNWYPWGEEAFALAKKLDKPIFLSIGYATCHWCHVMEHESFEDEEVAEVMNKAFVSIKVDREERPDIDSIYMAVCQMINRHGGWPLTIVMTPDKKPFFAGTYFPKHSHQGRIGMLDLVARMMSLWYTQRDKLLEASNEITKVLQENVDALAGEPLQKHFLTSAFKELSYRFDEYYGGFGEQPKFPTPHNLLFLLRYGHRTKVKKAVEMVDKTLTAMRLGGIFDQIGFGFHRYSTDQHWFLPHFEKMLYDQALLMMAYTEGYQVTQNPFYQQTVDELVTYIKRDMTDSEGGFYSAEDADSEGEEGKFYVWSEEELKQLLSTEEAELINKLFSIETNGNFYDEATRRKIGTNHFALEKELSEQAPDFSMDSEALKEQYESIRQQLFSVRKQRIHPLKDDKILTDWNGLMIAALAKAGRVFQNESYSQLARDAVAFIEEHLLDEGRLSHRYREGEAKITGLLDDYAFLVWGLIELYLSDFNSHYLSLALSLNQNMLEHFWDSAAGGLFISADDSEKLILRNKDIYDGASPSGNSVAMFNLVRLARLTGQTELEEKARVLGAAFSKQVEHHPSAQTLLMCALDFLLNPTYEIVIVGRRESNDTKELLQTLQTIYLPEAVILFKDGSDTHLEKLVPFVKDYQMINEQATAYICQNFACQQPTNSKEEMLKLLGQYV